MTLGRLMRKAEDVMGMPVEIEWALDEPVQAAAAGASAARGAAHVPDEIWLKHRDSTAIRRHRLGRRPRRGGELRMRAHPRRAGRHPGDEGGGAGAQPILPRVGGVVAELGGSTSHLASLARERGIPMVLGVLDATSRISDGAQVAVDGVAGIVRWMR